MILGSISRGRLEKAENWLEKGVYRFIDDKLPDIVSICLQNRHRECLKEYGLTVILIKEGN